MELILEHKGKKYTVMYDDADHEELSKYYWIIQLNKSGVFYARGGLRKNGGGKLVYMHRIIMRPPCNRMVDHINGCGIDNRRANLRICTKQENSFNCKGTRRFPYKGIEKSYDKWSAKIVFHGIKASLGRYDTMEEAARVYDLFAEKLHGEFFNPNIPKSQESA